MKTKSRVVQVKTPCMHEIIVAANNNVCNALNGWPAQDAFMLRQNLGYLYHPTSPHVVIPGQAWTGMIRLIHTAIYSKPYLAIPGLEGSVNGVLVYV